VNSAPNLLLFFIPMTWVSDTILTPDSAVLLYETTKQNPASGLLLHSMPLE
jgi:hypothetical protein